MILILIITNDVYSSSQVEENFYKYCSECGDCITKCPVDAISLEKGKDHQICSEFLDIIMKGACHLSLIKEINKKLQELKYDYKKIRS